MTKDELISISRLAGKVDEMSRYMITKDLFKAEVGRLDTAITDHISYTRAAAKAETDRIDSILKVNADALRQANNEANESKVSAARQTEDVAKTLREVVETTRSANSKSQSEVINPLVDRLSKVEQKQYEDKGKDTVADPIFEELVKEMKEVVKSLADRGGQSKISGPLQMLLVSLGGGIVLFIFQTVVNSLAK